MPEHESRSGTHAAALTRPPLRHRWTIGRYLWLRGQPSAKRPHPEDSLSGNLANATAPVNQKEQGACRDGAGTRSALSCRSRCRDRERYAYIDAHGSRPSPRGSPIASPWDSAPPTADFPLCRARVDPMSAVCASGLTAAAALRHSQRRISCGEAQSRAGVGPDCVVCP